MCVMVCTGGLLGPSVLEGPIELIGEVSGAILYVNSTGSGGAYTSIQDAVDAANPGDTVFVYGGIYYENVIINTPVTLIGERGVTSINGSGSGKVVKIEVDNVVVDGFNIESCGSGYEGMYEYDAGVDLYAVSSIRISNCTFKNIPKVGIMYFDGVSECVVENCFFYDIEMNAMRWSGPGGLNNYYNNTVRNNLFSGGYLGIVIYGSNEVRDTTISNNTFLDIDSWDISIKQAGYNFHEGFCSFNKIVGNIFTSSIFINSSYDKQGMYNISGNVFHGFLQIGSTFEVKVYHNDFLNYQAYDDGGNTYDDGYPSGGNYWSIYSGYDNFSGPDQDIPGGDGIGDINFSLDLDSVDNYPLINPKNDKSPPELELISPDNNTFIKPGTNLSFEITDLKLEYVRYSINGDSELLLQTPHAIPTINWSDGFYKVFIAAKDTCENYANGTYYFTIDSIPPVIILNSPDNFAVIRSGVFLNFSIIDINLLNVESQRYGYDLQTLSSPYNISTFGWADGYNRIDITAYDRAGNQNLSKYYFTIDTTPPFFKSGTGDFISYTGEQFAIYANFTDNTDVKHATIFYKKLTGQWMSMDMIKDVEGVAGSLDGFIINSSSMGIFNSNDSTDWHFYITATDGLNNVSHGSVTNHFVITIIDNIPPHAYAGVDLIINEDTPVTVDASGSWDNEGSFGLSYAWDWDMADGISVENRSISASHVYSDPGTFVVTLNVSDAYGNWDTDSIIVIVNDITAPIADGGLDLTVFEEDLCYFFGNGSSDNNGTSDILYNWTFYVDDTFVVLNGITPSFYFEDPGTYNLTLIVTDSAGNWDSDVIVVTVQSRTDGDGTPDNGNGTDDNYRKDEGLDLNTIIPIIIVTALILFIIAFLFIRKNKGNVISNGSDSITEDTETPFQVIENEELQPEAPKPLPPPPK